jgi:hypothetical protein
MTWIGSKNVLCNVSHYYQQGQTSDRRQKQTNKQSKPPNKASNQTKASKQASKQKQTRVYTHFLEASSLEGSRGPSSLLITLFGKESERRKKNEADTVNTHISCIHY